MNITSEFFSFNMWEWFLFQFLNELNLTYRRLTGFMVSFYFILTVMVPWGRFLFRLSRIKSQSWLWVAWSRDSHKLISELSSETRSYAFVIFIFLVFLLSFSVFASFIFLFFVSTSSKQKQRSYISSSYYL